uniref:Zn(2)-C6 fungal-type domain-containing protein n=1 Tax=Fusarium oxysporum (strain Fo5176) TaxID=660025 RepID=A0A0D2YFI6_FUSOF
MNNELQLVLDNTLTRVLQARACDQCYARKCGRTTPCKTCSQSGLDCSYRIKRKRKRKPDTMRTDGPASQTNSPETPDSSPPAQSLSALQGTPITLDSAVRSVGSEVIAGSSTDFGRPPNADENAVFEFADGQSNLVFDPSEMLSEEQAGVVYAQPPDSPQIFYVNPGPFESRTGLTLTPSRVPPGAPSILASPWPLVALQPFGSLTSPIVSPLSPTQMMHLVDIFLGRLHQSMPFFKKAYLLNNIKLGRHQKDRSFNALVHSICAYTLFQPIHGQDKPTLPARLALADIILSYTAALHAGAEFGQEPTLEAVVTSFFLFGCHFCRGKHNAAKMRLMEALTLAEILNLHDLSSYGNVSQDEADRRLRTLTALAIVERIYALQRGFVLQTPRLMGTDIMSFYGFVTQSSSQEGDNIEEQVATDGIRQMIDQTDFVDDTIIRCWKNKCQMNTGEEHIALESVVLLLTRYRNLPIPNPDVGRDTQQADILITRHWICSMLWSLASRHGYTSAYASSMELQPAYAIDMAEETIRTCARYPINVLETHGIGLAEKLYEIAVNLTQVAQACILDAEEVQSPMSSGLPDVLSLDIPNDANSVSSSSDQMSWTAQMPSVEEFGPPGSRANRVTAIQNKFLALFALFRGGNHPYLKPFMDILSAVNYPEAAESPTPILST